MPEPESGPASAGTKSPSELMDAAGEADFVARASSSSSSSGGMMGPAVQPAEEIRQEKEEQKAFEMESQQNAWASGAFKRGVALQVGVFFYTRVMYG